MCPHPPAFSIRLSRRPVMDEPLPALTTIPSPCPSAAAKPESRSLPTTIFACGQTSAQSRVSDCRSPSVPQAAKRIAHLRNEIKEHDRRYHEEAAPTISDRGYDRLYKELVDLEAKFPDLVTP